MLRLVLRIYSYLYHLLLCLLLAAVGGIGLLNSNTVLTLPMLPWEGDALAYWLFFGGVAGLLSLILAISGRLRFLFFLWTAAVLVLMVRGFFLSRYSFDDPGHFYKVLLLTFGALLAVLGAATRRRRN